MHLSVSDVQDSPGVLMLNGEALNEAGYRDNGEVLIYLSEVRKRGKLVKRQTRNVNGQ